jgi:uncharacterized protein YbjT (DUF2867 family)
VVAAVTLAITGATGFVGSHLLDLAIAKGHDVRALTRTATEFAGSSARSTVPPPSTRWSTAPMP